MVRLQRIMRIALIVLVLLAISTGSNLAQERSGDRSKLVLEALALRGADSKEAKPALSFLCKNISSANFILVNYWKHSCQNTTVTVDGLGCIRAYFACLDRERQLGSKPGVPEGATLDCDGRLKACQIKK